MTTRTREADATATATVTSSSSASASAADAFEPHVPSRYEVQGELGRGGVGVVLSALDSETRRIVAVKVPRSSPLAAASAASTTTASGDRSIGPTERFVAEARLTAQLEHPAIVPVYDVGRNEDGTPFYVMRRVGSRSLKDVLENRKRDGLPIARLASVLAQVARALAYAHSRDVMHRDVKPGNVLVGSYGEVYLADWGIACTTHDSDARRLVGTPGYIAPEMINSDWERVDHRVDLFALGAMLYQVLAGVHPFRRGDTSETLAVTLVDDPPPPTDIDRECPLLLADLCMELLDKDPDRRVQTAEEVARRLDEFLDGAKERERRATEARRLCDAAQTPLARLAHLDQERVALATEARVRSRELAPSDPVEKKDAVWQLEDRAVLAENEAARALADAIELFTKALGYDAACPDAHRGLADLYFAQLEAAARDRRSAARIHYETLVRKHDDGRYARVLEAQATISLRTSPRVARAVARPFVEHRRRLVLGDAVDLGNTPVDRATLAPGSWLVTLIADGIPDVRYPVMLARGAHHDGDVRLYTAAEIGEGFVYVPAGAALIGGDDDAYDALSRQEVSVGDFAIARFPVTFGAYCTFLDGLAEEEAMRRLPRDTQMGGAGCVVERIDGRWEPGEGIIEGDARARFPREEGHLRNVPVCLVDWFDARAFARAHGARMPTDVEWEKAARGVDARIYPWGDRFDATFCKMRDSRAYAQQPEPVGSFATDESPYGVRDLAGGMREWVADIHGERTAAELDGEAEPPPGAERGASTWRQIRGGNWNQDQKWARAASRGGAYALSRGGGLGFRLAKTLGRAGGPGAAGQGHDDETVRPRGDVARQQQ